MQRETSVTDTENTEVFLESVSGKQNYARLPDNDIDDDPVSTQGKNINYGYFGGTL